MRLASHEVVHPLLEPNLLSTHSRPTEGHSHVVETTPGKPLTLYQSVNDLLRRRAPLALRALI